MDYRLICTEEDLQPFLEAAHNAKIMAVDVETTGLDPHSNRMRLLQIAISGQPVLLVDCFTFLPDGRQQLKEILEGPGIRIFHNAKFDLQFLYHEGIDVTHIFDTMLAAQLLRTSGGPARAGLDAVSRHYLGEAVDKQLQLSSWDGPLSQSQLEYAAKDAEVLLRLRGQMLSHIYSNGLERVAKIEFDCVRAVARMEYQGIYLDRKRWEELLRKTEQDQQSALERLYSYSGRPSYQLSLWGEEIALNGNNFESGAYVRWLLKKNGIEVDSVSKRSLAQFAAEPLVKALLDYRRNAKAISSFLQPLPSMIHPVTGRLHPKYGQIGAWSGRMSCSGPNIQQIPRGAAFRRCFCAPEGRMLVIADYSQIELRVAAEISGDKRMRSAYQHGADLHTLTAALISETPENEVTKQQRQSAKAVNFGLIFGMGAEGLRQYAQQSYGVVMTEQQAVGFCHNFFKAYPGIAEWHRRIKEKRPSEERTLSGRKFIFEPGAGMAGLYNTPVQGTAADIAKAALGRIAALADVRQTRIVAVVHDEILLETDLENAEQTAVLLRRSMEQAGQSILSRIPCVAEAKISDSWAGK